MLEVSRYLTQAFGGPRWVSNRTIPRRIWLKMSVMLVLSSPHPVVDMAKAADWVALTNLKCQQK